MPPIPPKTPPGTMELLPREQMAFQAMLDTIRCSYERYGFTPIETPVFEEVAVLLTKSGGETEKQVYFVQSTGSRQQGHEPDLALRFDLTVPLARYVAEHEHALAFPFRRYQMQRVYRGERAQKGRFREFYQCDIDVIGKDSLSPAYDAELPVVIAGIFRTLNLGKFTIHVSNRKILKGFLESIGVGAGETKILILREIDKADKIGWDKVAENIAALGVPMAAITPLLQLIASDADNAAKLNTLRGLCAASDEAKVGLGEIDLLLHTTQDMGAGDVICFNPAITRGLDYYTGTVYETFLDAHKSFGSICSGGRYENLASHYTKSTLPGVGISIGATRLFEQMRLAGLVQAAPSHVQLLVTQLDPALAADYRRLASQLRGQGINTELYLEEGKLGKQIKYADRAGIPFALVMGSEEKAKGVVSLKNLQSGAQQEIALAEVAAAIAGGAPLGAETKGILGVNS